MHRKNNLNIVGRKFGNTRIDQWMLIAIAIETQLKVTAQDWIVSCMRVNTHPSTCVSFVDFIKMLDAQGLLLSGKKFFDKRTSLMDVMPPCLLKLTAEERREVMIIIKSIYELVVLCDDPVEWNMETVCGLAACVKLDNVCKLRAYYHVALKNPSVLIHDDGTTQDPTIRSHMRPLREGVWGWMCLENPARML